MQQAAHTDRQARVPERRRCIAPTPATNGANVRTIGMKRDSTMVLPDPEVGLVAHGEQHFTVTPPTM